MDRIKRSLKNINGRLFLALLVMGLCPTLYTTLRTFFLGQLFSDEQRKHIESFIHQGFLPDTDAFITEIDKMRIIREEIQVNDQEIISISR